MTTKKNISLPNHPVYDSAVGSIKLARIVISNNIQPTQDGTGKAYVIPVENNECIAVHDTNPLFLSNTVNACDFILMSRKLGGNGFIEKANELRPK